MYRIRRPLAVLGTAMIALALASTAWAAFQPLPAAGGQVNNDPANGIDPNQDAGISDVVGGSLAAGGLRVPWATFEQKTGSSQQIFVRAFKNGAWVTQGFPASLNIDPTKEAEDPAIDFAGAGRTCRGCPGTSRTTTWPGSDEHLREPVRLDLEPVAAVRRRTAPAARRCRR